MVCQLLLKRIEGFAVQIKPELLVVRKASIAVANTQNNGDIILRNLCILLNFYSSKLSRSSMIIYFHN